MGGGRGGFKGWWELVPFVASASLVLYTLVGVWVQSGIGMSLLWFRFLLCCLKDVVETMYNEGVPLKKRIMRCWRWLSSSLFMLMSVNVHQHEKR